MDTEEVVRRYQAGEKAIDIAKAAGVSRQRIYYQLKTAGYIPRHDRVESPFDTEIAQTFRAGITEIPEIADSVGCSTATVRTHLRRKGLVGGAPLWHKQAENYYKRGMTIYEVGEQINKHPNSVWRALRSLGVKMRRPGARKKGEPKVTIDG